MRSGRRALRRRYSAAEVLRANSAEDVEGLEATWRALDADGRLPSAQFGWTRAALRAFSDEGIVQVIAVHRGSRLTAVAPMVRKRWHGVCRWLLAGAAELGEPNDLSTQRQVDLGRLTAAMARGGTPLWLARLRADSPAVNSLRRACRGRALVTVRPDAPYRYVPLHEGWLDAERQLKGRYRSRLQAARAQAEALGPVSTRIHTPNLHELPELLDRALAVVPRARFGGSVDRRAVDLQRDVFFRRYAESACVDGTLRICFLRIGDRVAAAQVAIESGGGFWLLLSGANARFETCLPEELLLAETIRYAAAANLESFEFWGRQQPWMRAWTPRMRRCVTLRTYPFGWRGLAALASDAAVAVWRRVGPALPSGLRTTGDARELS